MDQQSQPQPLTDEQLLDAIRAEAQLAGEDQSTRAANRELAADYFYGRLPAPPPTPEGAGVPQSGLVSTDVADAVEAVLAEVLPAFTSQLPVEFVPFGPDDEVAADHESRVVNHVAAAAGIYLSLAAAIKDALLRRAGVVKVYWENLREASYHTLPFGRNDLNASYMVTPDDTIVSATDTECSIRCYNLSSRPRIVPVPLEELLVSSPTILPDLDQARFVAHRRLIPRGELTAMGYDASALDALDALDDTATIARVRAIEDTDLSTGHRSNEYILALEAYYRIDQDGDGIAELLYVLTAGGPDGTDHLLDAAPVNQQPFAVGVPYLGLYTWDGVSLFDKLRQIQDAKTAVLRSFADAATRAVRQRIGAVESLVNMDDLQTSVMGGIVRLRDARALVPVPDPGLPTGMLAMVEYLDRLRRDKGGSAIDSAAQAKAISGDTAHGIERVMAAAEQVNAMVALNLAETLVKPIYRKLHALLRTYQAEPLSMRRQGQWLTTDPGTWRPRDELVVSVGMSVGERSRRSGAIQAIIGLQAQAAQAGMDKILVGPDQVYRAALDLGRVMGLPGPEQYWIDPASPEAQQAKEQKEQAGQQAQAEAKQRQDNQEQLLNMQIQATKEVEMIRAQARLQTEELRNAGDLTTARVQAQVDEMKAKIGFIEAMLSNQARLSGIEAEINPTEAQASIDQQQREHDYRQGNPLL